MHRASRFRSRQIVLISFACTSFRELVGRPEREALQCELSFYWCPTSFHRKLKRNAVEAASTFLCLDHGSHALLCSALAPVASTVASPQPL